ncbi:MAG: hypothetical protein CSB48_11665 [Proteobacteria bacterium]|nr:MAG: hypothetical protein CSB48_11665 [Pseudomonadota bacterium]PIE40130.1 MAG: hypothetical protein CSA51_02520 [Gammaproteobacteria bacterium]
MIDDVFRIIGEQDHYVLAWVCYLISATGVCLVFLRMTKNIPYRSLRRFLRWSLVVLLYTPVYTMVDENWMVPAFLVGLYEYALGNEDIAKKAGLSLLAGIGIVLVVVKLEFFIRKYLHLQAD